MSDCSTSSIPCWACAGPVLDGALAPSSCHGNQLGSERKLRSLLMRGTAFIIIIIGSFAFQGMLSGEFRLGAFRFLAQKCECRSGAGLLMPDSTGDQHAEHNCKSN